MDIFKQKRNLQMVIVFLVVMNLATLTLLWLGKPASPGRPEGPPDPIKDQKRIEHLLKKELGFDSQQTAQYLKMRREQREIVLQLQNEIRRIKREMFDEVLQDDPQPVLSDSLLKLSQAKMAALEQQTFDYFVALKKLCKPEQQDKLKLLIRDYFHQNRPRGVNEDGPPPAGRRPGRNN